MKKFFYIVTVLLAGSHIAFAYDPSTQDASSVPDSIPSQTQDVLDQYPQGSKSSTQSADSPAPNEKNLSPEEVKFASQLTPQNRALFSGFSSEQRQLVMQIASKLQNTNNPIDPDMAVESVKKYSEQALDSNNENPSDGVQEGTQMKAETSSSSN